MNWDTIDQWLAAREPDPARVALFEEAGFDRERARRGAAMLVSGRYLGFVDAATTLVQEGAGATGVTEEKIAAAAKRAEAQAAARNRARRRTPFGREIAESGRVTPWGRSIEEIDSQAPVEQPVDLDFTSVGLTQSGAVAAAAGLREGRYGSFEEACLKTALEDPGHRLNESAMWAKGRKFAATGGQA